MPPEATHIEAPAGSIVMYHAATWHRQAVNTSASPRVGVLQAFVPDALAATLRQTEYDDPAHHAVSGRMLLLALLLLMPPPLLLLLLPYASDSDAASLQVKLWLPVAGK